MLHQITKQKLHTLLILATCFLLLWKLNSGWICKWCNPIRLHELWICPIKLRQFSVSVPRIFWNQFCRNRMFLKQNWFFCSCRLICFSIVNRLWDRVYVILIGDPWTSVRLRILLLPLSLSILSYWSIIAVIHVARKTKEREYLRVWHLYTRNFQPVTLQQGSRDKRNFMKWKHDSAVPMFIYLRIHILFMV
jgi:hypothetical protein